MWGTRVGVCVCVCVGVVCTVCGVVCAYVCSEEKVSSSKMPAHQPATREGGGSCVG